MSLSSVVDLAITFVQYFSSIIAGRSDFSLPASWSQVQSVTAVFSIGYDFIIRLLPSLSDFRVYFAAIAVLVPLFFIFLGLTFLNPLRALIWYLLVLASLLMTIVGALSKILFANVSFLHNVQINETILLAFVIAGPTLFAACGVMLYFRDRLLSFGAEPISEKETKEERMMEETEIIPWIPFMFRLLFGGAMVFFGLLMSGLVTQVPIDVSSGGFSTFSVGVGYTLIVLGSLMMIYAIVSVFQKGRVAQWKLNAFLEANFLWLYLILFSIIYIPIVTPIFLAFNCNTFTCSSGYRLTDDGATAAYNWTQNGTDGVCEHCQVYPNQTCPTYLQNIICAGGSDDRLESSHGLQCNKVRALFWPASICMILCSVLGIPAIFYDLINKSVEILNEKFPLRVDTQEEIRQKRKQEEAKVKLEAQMLEAQKQQHAAAAAASGNKYATLVPVPGSPVKHGGAAHYEFASSNNSHNVSANVSAPASPTNGNLQLSSGHNSGALGASGQNQFLSAQEQKAQKKKELEGEEDPNDKNAPWRKKVKASNNVAKFLYQPFLPHMKYTRLFFLIQKLLSVFLGVFVIRIPGVNPTSIQLGSGIVIHSGGFLFVALVLPFLFAFENGIALIMEVILAGTAVLSVLIFAQVSMPDWVYLLVLVLNGVLPVGALIIAIVLEWTSDRHDEEEQEKKKKEELTNTIATRKAAVVAKKKAAKEALEAKKQHELAVLQKKKQDEIIAEQTRKNQEEARKRQVAAAAAAQKAAAAQATAEEERKRQEALDAEEARIKKAEEEALAAAIAASLLAAAAEHEAANKKKQDEHSDNEKEEELEEEDGGGGGGEDKADQKEDEEVGSDIDLDDADLDETTRAQVVSLQSAIKELKNQAADLAQRNQEAEQDNQEKLKKYNPAGQIHSYGQVNHNRGNNSSDAASNNTASAAKIEGKPIGIINTHDQSKKSGDHHPHFSEMKVEVIGGTPEAIITSSTKDDGGEEMTDKKNTEQQQQQQQHLPHMAENQDNNNEKIKMPPVTPPLAKPAFMIGINNSNHNHNNNNMLPSTSSTGKFTLPPLSASPEPKRNNNNVNQFVSPPSASASKAPTTARPPGTQSYVTNNSPAAIYRQQSITPTSAKEGSPEFFVGADGALVPSVTAAFGGDEGDNFLLEDDEDEQENGAAAKKMNTVSLPDNFDLLSVDEQRTIRGELFEKKKTKEMQRQKQIRKLQQALDAQREEANKRLEQLQDSVDYGINLQIKHRLNVFLMIMGVIALFAMSLSAIGLLAENGSVVTSSVVSNQIRTVAVEFVGYGSWSAFTSNCCCTAGIDRKSASVTSTVIEKWICVNGKIIEHLREVKPSGNSTLVNGFKVRDLCGVNFNNGCFLQILNSSAGVPLVFTNCPSSSNISFYELTYLW